MWVFVDFDCCECCVDVGEFEFFVDGCWGCDVYVVIGLY